MLKKRLLAALTAFAMLSATSCDAAKEKKAEEERYQPATVQYGDENCIEIEKMLLEHLTNDGALDESKLADVTELRFAGLGGVSVVCGETGGTDMSEGFYEPGVDHYFEDRLFVYDDYFGTILSFYLYGEVRYIYDLPCVEDISFVEYMPKLECLEVPMNFVDDISPLSKCTELKMLNLCCSDKLEDISPLKSCTQLQELRLTCSKVSDISALAELKELRTLNLSYNEVDDLTALHELKLLDTLAVMGCKKSVLKDV
ncbi:MAG: leucine-rich repeat domain-containing protein, partial [Ruminococcaceae bacterium]|nr:leucine-rich repeat domain-containing protein [Oscillospiraceae bacterium]